MILPTLEGLLPEEYEAYRPVVLAALTEFLSGLSPVRRTAIVEAQIALAASPEADRFVDLLRRCPTLHKLGQVVARDRRVSPEFRQRLQSLETLEPTDEIASLRSWLKGHCTPEIFSSLELGDSPLAEGSVAVVLPVKTTVGGGKARPAILKMVKPGVRELLEEELSLWPRLTEVLEQECKKRSLAAPDIQSVFAEVRDSLHLEVHLEQEQAGLLRAAEAFEGDDRIVIPSVLPGSCDDFTLMSFLDGKTLTLWLEEKREGKGAEKDAVRPKEVARILVEALVGTPLFEPSGRSMFHGDPHAGNLLVLPDGRVGIVDWSLATDLEKEDRVALVQLWVGLATLDRRRVRKALEALALEVKDPVLLRRVAARSTTRVRRGTFPGLDFLISVLDDLIVSGAATFPGRLILFRKCLLTLSGLLSDLGSTAHDRILVAAALRTALHDWPKRMVSSPFKRDFGTHLSNADLLPLLAAGPSTTLRFWVQTWGDLLIDQDD